MARYTGPKCRYCRAERSKLFLKGDRCHTGKCPLTDVKNAGLPGKDPHGYGVFATKLGPVAVINLQGRQEMPVTDDPFRVGAELAMSENNNETGRIPVVAIIGRPNVGKSTLFNRLLGKRRAITSPEPGVTRDAIEERWYLGNHPITLVDSGGIKMEKEGLDDLVSSKSLSLLGSSDAILFMNLNQLSFRKTKHRSLWIDLICPRQMVRRNKRRSRTKPSITFL